MIPTLLMGGYEGLIRPILFRAYGGDPERIHERMISVLGGLANTPVSSLLRWIIGRPTDPVTIAGVRFPGRVGLAAGVDKDGIAARIWASLGFGFAEVGTVTAQAQPGNPKPRIFRLTQSQGLINRMGFNNDGASALAHRLESWGVRRGENALGIPFGISIGKTKIVDVDKVVEDYLQSFAAVCPYADYVAVNVSSPNTPGLRTLQGKSHIHDLITALVDQSVSSCRRQDLIPPPTTQTPVPIFVKLAPDLADAELHDLLEASIGAGASGLIATNTTLSRDGIRGRDLKYARQPGGLSGAPLTIRARRIVAEAHHCGLPVIASGGIMSAADAQAMFDLGAVAVQVYTGFIYHGPGLVADINAHCTSTPVILPQAGSPPRTDPKEES